MATERLLSLFLCVGASKVFFTMMRDLVLRNRCSYATLLRSMASQISSHPHCSCCIATGAWFMVKVPRAKVFVLAHEAT